MVVYSSIIFLKEETMNDIRQDDKMFDNAKTHYFSDLAASLKWTIKLHGELLWWGQRTLPSGKNSSVRVEWDWSNVTQHCLVVAARVDELALQMWLSDDIRSSLKQAAILHDAGKQIEKDTVTQGWLNWEAFDEAWRIQTKVLTEKWYNEDVIYLSWSAWHTALEEVREILKKWEKISERDIAFLILHYVDNYTVWDTEFETGTNPLKKRIQNNKDNERYRVLDNDGIERFGQTTFDEQLEVWTMLDEWFQKQLSQGDVPETIKSWIHKKISEVLD